MRPLAVAAALALGSGVSGQIVFEPGVAYPSDDGAPVAVAFGDLTSDGLPDLIFGQGFSVFVGVMTNLGGGVFSEPELLPASAGGVPGLVLHHIDDDEDLDVVFLSKTGLKQTVDAGKGKGNGTFTLLPDVWRDDDYTADAIALGEFTGDGFVDVVVSARWLPVFSDGPGFVDIVRGNGDGTFGPAETLVSFVTDVWPGDLAVGDLNGDEFDDLVVGMSTVSEALVFLSGHGGNLQAPETIDVVNLVQQVELADVDDDDDLDVVLRNGGEIDVFLNAGDGTFGEGVDVPLEQTALGMTVGDFDGDGLDDVVASSAASFDHLTVFRSRGDGTFAKDWVQTSPVQASQSLAAADFDLDGRVDLAGGVQVLGSKVATFRNRTYGGDEPFADIGVPLVGASAIPILLAEGTLVAGEPFALKLEEASPDAAAGLIVGLERALMPFHGGTLVPSPDVIVGPFNLGGATSLEIAGPMPAGVAPGTRFWIQYWLKDGGAPTGFASTTAVVATTP